MTDYRQKFKNRNHENRKMQQLLGSMEMASSEQEAGINSFSKRFRNPSISSFGQTNPQLALQFFLIPAKVTADFSMKLAIKKAKESGIGMVVAKGANHYSIAGHWALMGSGSRN